MYHYRLISVLVVLGLSASPVYAASYNPMIDFRGADTWSAANNDDSYTETESGVTLTLNSTPSPGTLWWDDKDGIGVRLSYENDEIESEEILNVVFKDAVSLIAIYVADLFIERGYIETGFYRINGGNWVEFDADDLPGTGSNGEHAIFFKVAIAGVTSVDFSAPGNVDEYEDHEFALMGFDVREPTNAVPEPTAALLFGVGMLIASRSTTRRAR